MREELNEKMKEQSERWKEKIEKMKNKREKEDKRGTSKVFIEKEFKRRASLLDQMFSESQDIHTLFNMGLASVMLMMINNCVAEYNASG